MEKNIANLNLSPGGIERFCTDINEIEEMDKNNVRLEFPDLKNMQEFFVYIKVSEGIYKNKWFKFSFVIPKGWPNSRPNVLIVNKIWHPNIGLVKDGHPECGVVSVYVTDKRYTASTTLKVIIDSIIYYLINPSPIDAQNPFAATEIKSNYDDFINHVNLYLNQMEDSDNPK